MSCLAIALSSVVQSAGAGGYFETPSEIAARDCGESALTLHPGTIESSEVLRGAKATRVEVHVRDETGKAWIVLCDAGSGKLLTTIDVDTLQTIPFAERLTQTVK